MWIWGIFWRQAAERGEQSLWVVVDGPDAVILKHRGEHTLQNFAVRQHVGDAAGDAEIIFEDGEAAVRQTHEIGAADADVNIARDINAAHFAAEMFAAVDQFARNDAFGEDPAFVVDVTQEKIQSGEALREAALDLRPLMRGNDARDEIVGEDALGAFFAAVDGEGDAFL